jgi:ADP-ribose pyrophosphatase YjhB (NUDIX family)
MSFEMKAIPVDKKSGWAVKIDGETKHVGLIEISSKFGTLTYGLRPEGYDAWSFREAGGGGAVTLPYAVSPNGELLVGLLKENRANMGGHVFCIMGGFVNPSESHADAQKREGTEESGLDTAHAEPLPGLGINSNRLFFVADAATEGVKAYSLHIPFTWLQTANNCFKLKPDNTCLDPKKSENLCFFPWAEAAYMTADAFAHAAILKLLIKLSVKVP